MSTLLLSLTPQWVDIKNVYSLQPGQVYVIENVGIETIFLQRSVNEPNNTIGHRLAVNESVVCLITDDGLWGRSESSAATLAATINASGMLDLATNSRTIIDYEHHEIHSGSHFFLCDYELNVADNDTTEFIITTPDTDK